MDKMTGARPKYKIKTLKAEVHTLRNILQVMLAWLQVGYKPSDKELTDIWHRMKGPFE